MDDPKRVTVHRLHCTQKAETYWRIYHKFENIFHARCKNVIMAQKIITTED